MSMLVCQTRRVGRRVRHDDHDVDGKVGGEDAGSELSILSLDRPWRRLMNDKLKKSTNLALEENSDINFTTQSHDYTRVSEFL